MRRLFIYIFVLAVYSLPISAQAIPDTVNITSEVKKTNSINTQFEKHLNIHTLRSQINYNLLLGNLFFKVNEKFQFNHYYN